MSLAFSWKPPGRDPSGIQGFSLSRCQGLHFFHLWGLDHLKSDLDLFDFELTDDEMKQLNDYSPSTALMVWPSPQWVGSSGQRWHCLQGNPIHEVEKTWRFRYLFLEHEWTWTGCQAFRYIRYPPQRQSWLIENFCLLTRWHDTDFPTAKPVWIPIKKMRVLWWHAWNFIRECSG